MRVRLDPGGDPEEDLERQAELDQPVDLVEGVDDEPRDAVLGRGDQFRAGLVVAVEDHPLGREAGSPGDGQLTAGADVETETLLGDPAGHRGAEKGLARVVDLTVILGKSTAPLTHPAPHVVLVEDVGRRAELLRQQCDGHAADGQNAVGAELRGGRPDCLVESAHGCHIRSGAETPSRVRPLARTVRVASQSRRRACRSGPAVAGSSTGSPDPAENCGSTRHAS